MRQAVVVLIALAALGGAAVAQPGTSEPATSRPDERSETVALALSLGGTAASYALVLGGHYLVGGNDGRTMMAAGAVGSLLAPSAGHWYAGGGMTRGFWVRLVGTSVASIGLVVSVLECLSWEPECSRTASGTLLVIGAGAYLVGTIDDLTGVTGEVRRYNARATGISVVPLAHRDGAGLALSGTF